MFSNKLFLIRFVCALLFVLLFAGCSSNGKSKVDAGTDTDTGTSASTDTDTDSDTDTDTDADSDTDTDTCEDGHVEIMDAGTAWVSVCGSSFLMGSNDGGTNEKPVHNVAVPNFEITKTEVTVVQYERCVTAGDCTEPSTDSSKCNWNDSSYDNFPVNCVNWDQAVEFCTWAGGRLPSEAEWEYAARSGGQNITYPWGNEEVTCDYAVMDDSTHGMGCNTGEIWEVCEKVAGNTTQGLCDMAGNAGEWVQDCYHYWYDGAPNDGSAREDNSKYRVRRGGGFGSYADSLRTTHRSFADSVSQSADLGFRCAR